MFHVEHIGAHFVKPLDCSTGNHLRETTRPCPQGIEMTFQLDSWLASSSPIRKATSCAKFRSSTSGGEPARETVQLNCSTWNILGAHFVKPLDGSTRNILRAAPRP